MTEVLADPRFRPIADHALLVQVASEISDEASQAVMALDRAITSAGLVGVLEVVPALVNLLIVFDPLIGDHTTVEAAVRELLPAPSGRTGPARRHEVLVCYEDSVAMDLPAVAALCSMSVEAVVDAHVAGDYRVAMYGFAPGYAYLAGVPGSIQVPRKPAAVRGVAAGSVIIAGPQCLVTTIEMPTGWSIIGRSPTAILRNDPDQPFLFEVADRVVLRRIDRAALDRLLAER